MRAFPTTLPPLPTQRWPHPASAIGMIVLYFVLQLAVGGLCGLILGLVAGVTRSGGAGRALPQQMRELFARPDTGAALVIVTLLVTATIVLLLVRRWWPQLWRQSAPPGLGLVLPRQQAFFAAAVLAGLALPVIGGWLTQLLAQGHIVTQDIKQLGGAASPAVRIPLVLVVVSVGPLVEEVLFRGLLLSSVLRTMRTGWAVAISSLLFGLVHLPDLGYLWYAVPNLALLAAVLAWLRLRSGSLWPAVLAHAVNNALAVVAWFVAIHPPA